MRRLIPFIVVFAAGIAIGYFLPGRGAPAPGPATTDAARTGAGESTAVTPVPAPSPGPVLEGRALDGATAHGATARHPAPRVAPDGRVQVVVRLVLPDGGTPGGGQVLWSSDPDAQPRSMLRAAWEPPTTSVFIQPGEVWMRGTGGAHASLGSDATQVRVSAEDPLQEVALTLAERPGIHGKVVLPAEFDRPRLTVQLLRYAGDAPPEKPSFDGSARSVQPDRQDGYGFAFRDLKPGGYLLGLSLGARDVVLVEDVRVRSSLVEQDLVVREFDPKRFMEVSVLGPSGQLLRDAQVSISFSGQGMAVSGGNVSLLRSDGVFVVDHLPGHTLQEDGTHKAGIYTVRVRTGEHGEIVRPYDPSSTHSLTIRVGELQGLAVQLTGYAAVSAPSHLRVGVRQVGETGVRNAQGIEPDGSVHFGAHPPGSYEVVMLAGQPRASLVAAYPIEFAPGDSVKEVPTPTFHRLVLRLPTNAVEPEFRLTRTFGTEQWSYGRAQAAEPGEMVFEYLTEGIYTLQGHVGSRWVKREVRLPAESEIRLD